VSRRGCRIRDLTLSSLSLQSQITDLWSAARDGMDSAQFLAHRISLSSSLCREHAVASRRRDLQQSERGLHTRLASIHRLQQAHL